MENIFGISLTGLNVEKQRMDLVSLNLANANSSADKSGNVYKPLRLVSQPLEASFGKLLGESVASTGTQVTQVVEADVEPRKVHDPSHPYADDKGFVKYANVNTIEEMMTMLSATRAYEANIKAISATKAMALAALDIGKK